MLLVCYYLEQAFAPHIHALYGRTTLYSMFQRKPEVVTARTLIQGHLFLLHPERVPAEELLVPILHQDFKT